MERTVTFTMEDALISPLGFAILSGAGLIEANTSTPVDFHMTSQVIGEVKGNKVEIDLSKDMPSNGNSILSDDDFKVYAFLLGDDGSITERLEIDDSYGTNGVDDKKVQFEACKGMDDGKAYRILVDYYIEIQQGATQMEITPDKFAGNYYLEASTLFRRQSDGVDMPAQFIVPNVKIQSAFNFSLSATGDPSEIMRLVA
ncbi:MAG: hypothetical protein HUJ68_11975 [Clostridia bacterium]|nr:hypothetical protein [Clostridia bacterium]